MTVRCPVCYQAFSEKGLAIHHGIKHFPRRCRSRGDNRGWCVAHDMAWRIDRSRCEQDADLRAALDGEAT
jgi:hypothetical protein